jgi:hypothetical protein
VTKTYAGDPDRVALVLPGGAYTPDQPLLYYAREVLLARGWTVHELWWTPSRDPDWLAEHGPRWVAEQAEAALAEVSAGTVLLVAKSLGSLALPVAASRSLPGIWFTPLLHLPVVVAALPKLDARALLIGGGADESWDADVAESSGHEVYEVYGADHALERPGHPLSSIDVLRGVTERVDKFVATL